MPLEAPPGWVYYAVERRAPGLIGAFVGRVNQYAIPGTVATSWWRSPEHNLRVGGDRDSQHLLGLAADLDHRNLGQLEQSLRRSGLIVVPYADGSHLHVQAWPAGWARQYGLLGAIGA